MGGREGRKDEGIVEEREADGVAAKDELASQVNERRTGTKHVFTSNFAVYLFLSKNRQTSAMAEETFRSYTLVKKFMYLSKIRKIHSKY